MSLTPSTMLALGQEAPDFSLPATDGKTVSLADFQDAPAFLAVFLCNHCPFVKYIQDVLADLIKEYQERGLVAVGISSNDAKKYPQDGPKEMAEEAANANYTFPYLYDEDQSVAKAYQAACTPDFFLFDKERKLVYRGQFDASRPGNAVPVTGASLRVAIETVLASKPPVSRQLPSMGCNIKWKPGNEPDYFQSAS